jgi:hypothetical protein
VTGDRESAEYAKKIRAVLDGAVVHAQKADPMLSIFYVQPTATMVFHNWRECIVRRAPARKNLEEESQSAANVSGLGGDHAFHDAGSQVRRLTFFRLRCSPLQTLVEVFGEAVRQLVWQRDTARRLPAQPM